MPQPRLGLFPVVRRRTVLAGLAGLAAIGGRAARAAAPTLRIGLAAPATTIDPHFQNNAPNNSVATHLFDTLVANDEQSRLMPCLALSWRALDDTHWEFKLRPDVRFSDGTPLTPDDIIVSFTRASTLPSTASFKTYTRGIKSMRAADPATLLIETAAPDPLLPSSVSRIRIIKAALKDAPTSDFNAGKAAIGTGPYRLAEYVPGSHVALVPNEAYWGRAEPWSTITLRFVTGEAARLSGLLAGDLDLIEAVPAEGAQRIAADHRFQMVRAVSNRLIYLGFDLSRDVTPYATDANGQLLPKNPFLDLRVRRAVSRAINRQAIVDRVMEGQAIVAAQFLPKGRFGTSDKLEPDPYDPAGAKALLAEAGYPQGFKLTIHGPNDRYINDAKVLQAVAQMLGRVGIATEAQVMPWAVYGAKLAEPNYSLFFDSWGANTGETSNPMAACVATYDAKAGLGVGNTGRYSNPRFDAVLIKALHTLDDTERAKLLAEASEIVIGDAGILPLHHEVSQWAARTGIEATGRADQYTLAMGVRPKI